MQPVAAYRLHLPILLFALLLASCVESADRAGSGHKVWVVVSYDADGKFMLTDLEGRRVSDTMFDETRSFSEGLAAARDGNRWGDIDVNGSWKIPPKFDEASRFSEGYAWVRGVPESVGDLRYLIVNGEGTTVGIAPAEVDSMPYPFSEGLSVGSAGWCKYGYLATDGAWAIPPRFVTASSFRDGLAHVTTNFDFDGHDKEGYLCNKQGELTPAPYCYVDWDSDWPKAVCMSIAAMEFRPGRSLSRCAYVDEDGKVVIPEEYGRMVPFSEGVSAIWKPEAGHEDDEEQGVWPPRGAWYIVDTRGDVLARVEEPGSGGWFEVISPCRNGLFEIRSELCGAVDRHGKVVVYPYHRSVHEDWELWLVGENGLFGRLPYRAGEGAFLLQESPLPGLREYKRVAYPGDRSRDHVVSLGEKRLKVCIRDFGLYDPVEGRLVGWFGFACDSRRHPLVHYFSTPDGKRGWLSGGGYIDEKGELVDLERKGLKFGGMEFNAFIPDDGPLSRVAVRSGEKLYWGFVDDDLVLRIKPVFDDAHPFSEGLARVVRNGRVEYIDASGDTALSGKWDDARRFSCGRAAVMAGGRWHFVDRNGNRLPGDYASVRDYRENRAVVELDGKFGLVDESGATVLPASYPWVGDMSDGLTAVQMDGKIAFVDRKGEVVKKTSYEAASCFSEGLCAVMWHGKWGYIDGNWTVTIPLAWEGAGEFRDGYARVWKEHRTTAIDKTGTDVLPPWADATQWRSD